MDKCHYPPVRLVYNHYHRHTIILIIVITIILTITIVLTLIAVTYRFDLYLITIIITGQPSAGGVVPAGALSGYTSRLLTTSTFRSVREIAKNINAFFPEDIKVC